MGVMLTNKNWETPYYAHIGDKDKLGNMWSANLHYLNIPIHIGYMMPVSKKISLFMNAGPYWGVGLFGKYTMTSGDKDTTIAENIFKDYLKRFDCGIGVGVAYEIGKFFVGLDGEFGFTNVVDFKSDNVSNPKNMNFSIGVGYKF